MNPNVGHLSCRDVGVIIDGTTLLEHVDFVVTPGEWVSIIGPNGAGKSTLLRAISGAIKSTGTISIGGSVIADLNRRDRAQLFSWVAQAPEIPVGIRVIDYVLLGRTPHLSPLGRESDRDIEIALGALRRLDLQDLGDRMVATLSGGERQRVLIARALTQETPIVLLDEPTTALDLGHQQDVLDLLEQLRTDRDLTILSTMHDLSMAGQYADRLVLLANGRIQTIGAPAEVLTVSNLEQHYGANVRVVTEPDGTLLVVPKRIKSRRRKRPDPMTEEHEPTQDATEAPPEENPIPSGGTTADSVVIVNTGDGKGKSSAAFGVMVRALAVEWPVAVVQFIKSGDWKVGEEKMGRKLGVEWHSKGDGFTWDSDDMSHDMELANEGWQTAKALITAGEHRLIILDEITYLLTWGWVSIDDVVDTIRNRPKHVNVVCTGRDAPQALIDVADTVTEMRKVSHAYDTGILAKRGIDY